MDLVNKISGCTNQAFKFNVKLPFTVYYLDWDDGFEGETLKKQPKFNVTSLDVVFDEEYYDFCIKMDGKFINNFSNITLGYDIYDSNDYMVSDYTTMSFHGKPNGPAKSYDYFDCYNPGTYTIEIDTAFFM